MQCRRKGDLLRLGLQHFRQSFLRLVEGIEPKIVLREQIRLAVLQ